MERLPLTLLAFAGLILAGCSSGAQASVSEDEEKMFKNPPPVDRSKIPADAFKPRGPSFIGEPTKGSGASATPPPIATGR